MMLVRGPTVVAIRSPTIPRFAYPEMDMGDEGGTPRLGSQPRRLGVLDTVRNGARLGVPFAGEQSLELFEG
jgi:hypothetical protein